MSYELILAPGFVEDLRRLAAEARRDPSRAYLRQQVLQLLEQLANGTADGHRGLGHAVGRGDLRDCVTAYVQSDPQQSADYRLVFREIGPESTGQPPRRELLAVKPRHGTNNAYAHACARLNRHPADRQPGLSRFGDRAPGVVASEADRRAELDARRAIAHAWAGQRPLASSRPFDTRVPAMAQDRVPAATQHRGEPRPGRESETGWPERRGPER